MAINRRKILAGASATALTSALSSATGSAHGAWELFAATRKSSHGTFAAVIFRRDGVDVNTVKLSARGHDVAACAITRTVVAFARRPGNFAVAFSADRARRPIRFTCPSDRHFYGHGVFSRDGRLLFATENDFEAGVGCIGIYDANAAYNRTGQFDAFGVGPHDIALTPDGETLLVAVGGIETHPEIGHGRTKLNIATMSPALVYIDAKSGNLIEKHELPSDIHKLSLRHLGIGASCTTIVGGQLQRGASANTPLILRHRRGNPPELIELPVKLTASMRGYISSVAVNRTGDTAALTSSRGGMAILLELASGAVKQIVQLHDVSGVAPAGAHFLFTSGEGAVVTYDQSHATPWVTPWAWDNHVERVVWQNAD